MRSAIAHLRAWFATIIGLEGLLFVVGVTLLAVGASYVSPAGPWFVVGAAAVLLGLVLAIPPQRTS